MSHPFYLSISVISSLFLNGSINAVELSGSVSTQARVFNKNASFSDQKNNSLSLIVEPEFYHDWDSGKQSIQFKPYLLLDSGDNKRTHADIRELIWTRTFKTLEMQAGMGKVFWGVTEGQHLVDVINQTDLVDSPDGEEKLGQPMLKLSTEQDWGVVDLYLLPGFRERTFPGKQGRFRTRLVVDESTAAYESSAKQHHLDMALRWSHYFGDWDIGVSHFSGTSRDPIFIPFNDNGVIKLQPFYEQMNQTSVDVQATLDALLVKYEMIYRESDSDQYFASTGGVEYSFYGVAGTDADLGIIAEFMYDDRGNDSTSIFNHDLFAAIRWTANDVDSTEVLAGVFWDWENDSKIVNLEASRRFGNNWKASIQSRVWDDVDKADPLINFENDDYIEFELTYYY